jgi:hypothetical protein
MSETYDQVLMVSILRSEVSEIVSEPCLEILAIALDTFHGAMIEESVLNSLVVKM